MAVCFPVHARLKLLLTVQVSVVESLVTRQYNRIQYNAIQYSKIECK